MPSQSMRAAGRSALSASIRPPFSTCVTSRYRPLRTGVPMVNPLGTAKSYCHQVSPVSGSSEVTAAACQTINWRTPPAEITIGEE